jgi:HemY protein
VKALLWVVAGLALAVGLTLAARSNDGLAILVVPPYRLTFSLNFFVLLLLALFLLLHGLLRLAHHMLALPRQARAFKAARRAAQARAAFQAALVALLEGRFASAEKQAEDAATQGESPALAHLLAARAALAQHAPQRVARHLAAAAAQDGEHALARLVVQAECLLDEGRGDEALALLDQAARTPGGDHTHLLRLKLRTLQLTRQWAPIPGIVAQLVERGALTPEEAETLRATARMPHQTR